MYDNFLKLKFIKFASQTKKRQKGQFHKYVITFEHLNLSSLCLVNPKIKLLINFQRYLLYGRPFGVNILS